MKKLITFILVLFIYSNSFSQEIGQPAEQVLSYIKYRVERHNKPDSYGRYSDSRYSYDVKYSNGVIKDVIVFQSHMLLIPLKKYIDLETHFQMENGVLTSITAVYNSLSRAEVSKLKKVYGHKLSIDGGEYYLSDDFKGVEKVYMNIDNIPCAKYFEDGPFFEKHSSIINEVKQKVKSEKQQQEREIEENKYVNLEDIDPAVKDKISFQYLDVVESDFKRDSWSSKIKRFCKELEEKNKSYWTDSSIIKLRIEMNHYGTYSNQMDKIEDNSLLFDLFGYRFIRPDIPKPKYRQINFIDFDSLKTYSTVGTFKFYVKSKGGKREVVILEGKKLPPGLEDEVKKKILNDDSVKDNYYHSMRYISFTIHNVKQSLFNVEKIKHNEQEKHLSAGRKGLRLLGKIAGGIAVGLLMIYSL